MDEGQFASNAATIERMPPGIPKTTQRTAGITVAAIIPLYNGAPFIREALESVLSQTEPADEIIVVDDGSTDDGAGPAIVKEMATRHPIRLLTKQNGGQGSARNFGIAECNSTHIALLDQDDIWYEDHLEILKKPFLRGRHRNLGLVYGNMDRIDKAGRMIRHNFLDEVGSPHPKVSLQQCLSQDMFILPGASLFTKAAWEKAGHFDERLAGYEDDDLFIRMFSVGINSVYLKDKAVFRWRIYSGSTSYSPRMAKSRMIYFRKLVAAYPDEPRMNMYWCRDAIGSRFFHILYCEFIDASRARDLPRMTQAWSDISEVLPVMPRRLRRRMALVSPLISMLYGGPLGSVARSLFRWAKR
jgi:glycosyltransferase involved in cell wall biosynthesis